MEQPKSSDNAWQKIYPDLVSKIKSRQVVTLVVNRERLTSYLDAGLATGFRVEKIADEGEDFPCWQFEDKNRVIEEVRNIKVQGEGCIAVSIERPGGTKDHAPFWENLKRLEQAQVPSSPKSR